MKKGFTLIELLSVIIILAVIIVIAVPKILKVIDDVKTNAYISNEKMVTKAAELYISNNVEYLPVEIGNTSEIELTELVTKGYIKEIKNPNDKNESCNGYVLVTKTDEKSYDYVPHINCDIVINNSTEDLLIGHWKLNETEEGTTNLWVGGLSIYNNLSIPATLVATGEIYKGASVYRLTMTPTTQAQVDSIKSSFWNHGVVGSNITYLGSTKYTSSIYWKPINKTDVQVDGLASNIGGWASGINEVLGDGWTRCISHRNGTVVDPKTGYVYWSFKSPSFVLGDTMIIDWAAPQIEQKDYASRYTSTTRNTIAVDLSKNSNSGIINGATFSKQNDAFLFDGFDDFVTIPVAKPTGDFSLSLWAKRTGDYATAMAFATIAGWRYVTESLRGLEYFSDYKINFKDFNGSSAYVHTGIIMSKDKWYNIVLSYKLNTINVYINGELVKSEVQTPSTYTSNEFQIGGTNWTTGQNRSFYGNIKDVKVYGRSLNTTEIKNSYDVEKNKYK